MSLEPMSTIEDVEDVESFRLLARIPAYIQLFSPADMRPEECSEDFFVLYEYPFKIGFTWPFSPLARAFMQKFDLSPGQLMPQFWRIVYVIERVMADWETPFVLNDLLMAYMVKMDTNRRYSLFSRYKHERALVQSTAVNDRGWKFRYVLGRVSSLSDDDHWIVSGWNTDVIKFHEVEPLPDSQSRIDRFLQYSVDDRSFYRTTTRESDSDDNVVEV